MLFPPAMLVHQTRYPPASSGSKRESHVFSRMSLTRRNTSLRDNAKLRTRLARKSSPKQAMSCFSPRDRQFHFQRTPTLWHFSAITGRSCEIHVFDDKCKDRTRACVRV
ncbi:hypothetical protein CGCSCA4_v005691 [Colletotrichum siamense]|uniref:Uncharacterized protein n=1 Tax=Colletotrichum siamense TaxID=690259 RepID=A0A9P5EV81_COLSI|nr:hypothetical protein CGCSCA4_v005691 [Colletotrichum siamense]KAF4860044.1 hypothetical protein CGCSCA2_v005739 [Colletotrichum siamense]